jgi:hypothetical protein
VAQAKRTMECLGAKWIARTPPKRQGEGSNPSEPVLHTGFIYIFSILNDSNSRLVEKKYFQWPHTNAGLYSIRGL